MSARQRLRALYVLAMEHAADQTYRSALEYLEDGLDLAAHLADRGAIAELAYLHAAISTALAHCATAHLSYHSGARGPLPEGRGANGPLRFLGSNTRALLPVGARGLTPCGVACGPVHCAHPVACARRSSGQAASGYNRRGPLQSHVGWPSIRTPASSGGHPARRSASCRSAEKPLAFAMGSVTSSGLRVLCELCG